MNLDSGPESLMCPERECKGGNLRTPDYAMSELQISKKRNEKKKNETKMTRKKNKELSFIDGPIQRRS
jgi:hypothetical protein